MWRSLALFPGAAALQAGVHNAKSAENSADDFPKQCVLSSAEMKDAFDQQLRPILEKYTDAFKFALSAAFYGVDNAGEKFTWSFVGGYNDIANYHPR